MYKRVLSLFFLFAAFSGPSQVITNGFKVPGIQVSDVFSDQYGNFYALGFQRSYYNYLPDSMHRDYYVRKYSPGGSLLWEKKIATHKMLNVAAATFVNDKIFLGGAFKDTLFFQGGTAVANGSSDIFICVINAAGQLTVTSNGDIGKEEMYGFAVDPSENIYLSCKINGQVHIGAVSHTTAGNECLLMKTSAGLSTSAWFKKGTAAAGDSIAVPWIMYDNNKLLATSAGSTNIVASNESFGCGIGCVSGNKWDLTGKLRGSIPDFATPLSNTFTHFTDNQQNYYTVAASHGNHGEWMNLIIKYDTTLVEKWKFEDRVRQHFVYNLLENGGSFYSSATAYDSSETLSHHIILHDNGTGNALKYFSHPLGKNYATAYIKHYLPGKLFTYGIFNQQIKLGQTTLSANTASISESYIAHVNWNLVGLAEAYGEKTSLTVFPNPSKGNFKIRLPAGKQQCTVVNAIGEVIAERTIQGPEAEIQIDVTPGIYFLQLKGDKATCLKLVVD